jgi:uncharacterized protein with NAD-binding domain and iron-sulfur cluster
VLIAVLAAAFTGDRMTLRRTIGLLMGVARSAGVIGATEPGGPRRWRPRAARQQRPRSRASARGGHCCRFRGSRVGCAGWFVMLSGGDEATMIADDVVSASIM